MAHQEQELRNGRNGLAMDHAHGYGGDVVTSVGFATDAEAQAKELLGSASPAQRPAAKAAVKSAERASAAARRQHKDAVAEEKRQSTKPREIYVRDTTRDGIVTAAKLSVHMLIEYVMREYFGGRRMEARTFIESLVNLPVTIRHSEFETIYDIQENPRNPEMMTRLRTACAQPFGGAFGRAERGVKEGGVGGYLTVVSPSSCGADWDQTCSKDPGCGSCWFWDFRVMFLECSV